MYFVLGWAEEFDIFEIHYTRWRTSNRNIAAYIKPQYSNPLIKFNMLQILPHLCNFYAFNTVVQTKTI